MSIEDFKINDSDIAISDLKKVLHERCVEKDYEVEDIVDFHLGMIIDIADLYKFPLKEFKSMTDELNEIYESILKTEVLDR